MPVLLAVLALAAALLRRWGRTFGTTATVEAIAVLGAALLALVGLLATVMAVLGWFSSQALVLVYAATAVLIWPWGQVPSGEPERAPPADGWRVWLSAAGLALATLALRIPEIPAELGGRDQGTYVLRARHTLRTGALGLTDPVLATAGRGDRIGPGPGDILELYPASDDPARAGRYEAAYRPGFYLADRARGEVVPQFLHLHPTLLATVGLIVGAERMTAVLHLEAVLAVLALWALARRLLPPGPWSLLAAGLYACSPLAVWVQRTPLTEPLTGLLLLAAALALARGLRERGVDMTVLAAALLGATAWIRGNAWLGAPLLLAVLWLSPQASPRRLLAPALYVGLLVGSLAVHVATCYPYLHDELRRQLGGLAPLSLPAVGLGAGVAFGLWLLVDHVLKRHRGRIAWLPRAWVIAAALALLVYLGLALRGGAHSRLDPAAPLLGVGLLLAAAVGAVRFAATRPSADPHATWLLALASAPVHVLALYAQRNLPQATLYYYGRYLVPELLPVACLLAAYAVQAGFQVMSDRTGPRRAAALAGAAALGLLGAQLWPYLAHPVTRLQEFAGAGVAVDALAGSIEEDAIVLAGGEGWHSAHTFNQIGGALAIGRGRHVLPYRSHEAAYAALHELLIAGPAARDRAPPRVYLLLNEASHVYRPRDESGRPGPLVAAIDDGLPPPFVARPVGLVELLVDRLSPVTGELPTRVTRADLRLGLFAVEVDPALQARIRAWRMQGSARGPAGLRLEHALWRGDELCLDPDRPLVLRPPAGLEGPVSLVLLAGTGGAPGERWQVAVDGASLDLRPPAGMSTRDSLGPFTLPAPPRRIAVRGAKHPRKDATCPHGSLAELRLLPPETAGLSRPHAAWAATFAPPDDLGHAPEPVRWVAGRTLSRARPGTTPAPSGGGHTLGLRGEQRLEFAWSYVPGDSLAAHDLVVNLRDLELPADARIELWDGDLRIGEIDPPERHPGAWQSPPLTWRPRAQVARLAVVLRSADPNAAAELRDLAIFGREVVATSELAD